MGETFDALLEVEKRALAALIESDVQRWQFQNRDLPLTPEKIGEYRDHCRETLAGNPEIVTEALEHYDNVRNAEHSHAVRLAKPPREAVNAV